MSYIQWIRSHVGKQKIFLVFATVIVLDDNGRILLQQRTDFSFWGLPGGVMELNEDIQTTARREVQEETGLKLGELSLVGVYTDPKFDVVYPNGDAVQQFTICFSAMAVGGRMKPDGEETTFQQFVEPDVIEKLELPLWYRQMVTDFLTKQVPAFCEPFCADKVIDQIWSLRPLVGHQKLIAVGGSAIIRNETGAVLMVQRTDIQTWVFPAGYADIGENVAYTIVREVKEETNLTITPKRIIGIFTDPLFHHTYPNKDEVQNVGVLFEAAVNGGTIKLQETELMDFAWVLPTDIVDKMTINYRPYGKKIVAHLEKGVFVF